MINIDTILKFIKNSEKIRDMEPTDKNIYHLRVSLKGSSGPYLDLKFTDGKFMTTPGTEVIYNNDSIYSPSEEDTKQIKQVIEIRQDEINKKRIQSKKEEFLKIVEDI